jgi:hypothetical protein
MRRSHRSRNKRAGRAETGEYLLLTCPCVALLIVFSNEGGCDNFKDKYI